MKIIIVRVDEAQVDISILEDDLFAEEAGSAAEAVVSLMELGERDAWLERAKWLYEEAPEADKPARKKLYKVIDSSGRVIYTDQKPEN